VGCYTKHFKKLKDLHDKSMSPTYPLSTPPGGLSSAGNKGGSRGSSPGPHGKEDAPLLMHAAPSESISHPPHAPSQGVT